jgi:hypothetical protein
MTWTDDKAILPIHCSALVGGESIGAVAKVAIAIKPTGFIPVRGVLIQVRKAGLVSCKKPPIGMNMIPIDGVRDERFGGDAVAKVPVP